MKARVLIVDDSVVMRRILSEALNSDPEMEVAGVAANGQLAMTRIPQINPDAITLDIEMPGMNGLETLINIRRSYPDLPVFMVSSRTERGAAVTLDALTRGATDYVTKPVCQNIEAAVVELRRDLVPRIKEACRARLSPTRVAHSPLIRRHHASRPTQILAIAASTGGPNALQEVLSGLPPNYPVPIVVVQHMPPMFTAIFSERLNHLCALRVHEVEHGAPILAGNVYIAPGGKHLEVQMAADGPTAVLHEGPPENSCRPAADVLFRSVARLYGGSVAALVLTGMGQDGLRGCEYISEAGGRILVQDEATSVVWGMPAAVAQAGLAEQILPLTRICGELLALFPSLQRRVS